MSAGTAEDAADFLTHWLGSPFEFAENTGDEWDPVVREVIKALDEVGFLSASLQVETGDKQ